MKNVLLLLAILIAPVWSAAAQSAADGLDMTLVAYYRWCNRHKRDPEMPLKADTMFRLAEQRQNPRMQSVALCLKTDYYYHTDNLDSLKVWVARTQEFTRRHNQLTHYYFIWTRLISYYSKYSRYTLAQYELERFRDQAVRDDYKPAIADAYKQLGHIYRTQYLYEEAVESYLKSIEMVERSGLTEVDASYLYLQLGELYLLQLKFDKAEEALRMSEKTILLPEHIWRTRLFEANLLASQGEFDRAEELLGEIREKSGGYIPKERIEEIEMMVYKGSRRYRKAMEIVDRQLESFEMPGDSTDQTHYFFIPALENRASLHYMTGNYRASADDLARVLSLIHHKYRSDNQKMLNEFATLFDVERLDREKVEARQQAQAERLRRARQLEVGLVVILALATLFIVILTRLNRRLARAKRAAEESSRMKGLFIRSITHEINTPLNAIVGFAELASTAPDDEPERSSYIDIIRENSGYLQKLIDDVLYIADIESSEAPPSCAEVEVDSCCRRCIESLSKHSPLPTEIRFIPGSGGQPPRIRTSCLLLSKALTELLRNAVRFTDPEKGVSLSYTLSNDGRRITFAVEDAGPGIPEAERERIFERFVKLDTFDQGLGLGLSVCRLIARTLGGDVLLDTSCSSGARFLLTIPT